MAIDDQYVDTVCKQAVDTWGTEPQMIVAIEESAELIKELTKTLRGRCDRRHVIEEIADLELMLDQMKHVFKVTPEELEIQKLFKLQRVEQRIAARGLK